MEGVHVLVEYRITSLSSLSNCQALRIEYAAILGKLEYLGTSILYTNMYIICKYIHKSTENNLWQLPWRPHMCTLYQIMYALTSSGQHLILGHRTPYTPFPLVWRPLLSGT